MPIATAIDRGNIDSGGECICKASRGDHPQRSKGGTAGFGQRHAQPPLAQSDHIEGHGREQMLQMYLRKPTVTCVAEATPPDALGVRALDTCPRSILAPESSSRLPSPRGLDGFMVGVRPYRELARGIFGPGARLAGWTGPTGRPRHPAMGFT